ncbi:hypothetical protein CI102_14329 [Trichoderma harzianum]|nr:hypothetical protein CI102_14329 [Trichoderma harzianum]
MGIAILSSSRCAAFRDVLYPAVTLLVTLSGRTCCIFAIFSAIVCETWCCS